MRTSAGWPAGYARRRVAGFALWRAVTAAPAVLGSLRLMLVSIPLGRWAALLLLAWLAGAAVLMTRVGERVTVRAVGRFHRPSPVRGAALLPAWSTALRVTGTAAGDVELYVRMTRAPNAYAAGGRSVAVTSGAVQDYTSGQLPEAQLVVVLVHELGHLATGATRAMLLLSWLTAPARVAGSLLTYLASILAGRQSPRGARIAVLRGLVVAAIRTLDQGQWMVGGVLVFLGLTGVLCPVADAAISRRAEYAADRFAADHGLALELAAALYALDDGHPAARGWSQRLLAAHPPSDQRIRALLTATAAPPRAGDAGCQVVPRPRRWRAGERSSARNIESRHSLRTQYSRSQPSAAVVTNAPHRARPACSSLASASQRSKIKSQDGSVRAGPTTDPWQSGSLRA